MVLAQEVIEEAEVDARMVEIRCAQKSAEAAEI
jgi:hypothetical protein